MNQKPIIYIYEEEPSSSITTSVMEKIRLYDKRRFKTEVLFHSILTLGAIIAFIPTIKYLIAGINESGILSYLSLIGDGAYILTYLKELLLSIVTSWPILATISIILVAMIFINSIRRIIQYSFALSEHELIRL